MRNAPYANIYDSLSTQDRRHVQQTIRSNWMNKSAHHPFLGSDIITITKQLRMTQEQYAMLWQQSNMVIRRVGGQKSKAKE